MPATMDARYTVASAKYLILLQKYCRGLEIVASTQMFATDLGREVECDHDFVLIEEIDHTKSPSVSSDASARSRNWVWLSEAGEPEEDSASVRSTTVPYAGGTTSSYTGRKVTAEPKKHKVRGLRPSLPSRQLEQCSSRCSSS